jgi:hypothetical protein
MREKRFWVVAVRSCVPAHGEQNGSADEQKSTKEEIGREERRCLRQGFYRDAAAAWLKGRSSSGWVRR